MRRVVLYPTVVLFTELTLLFTEASLVFSTEPPSVQFTNRQDNATTDTILNDPITSPFSSENVATTHVDPVNTSEFVSVTSNPEVLETTGDDRTTTLDEYPPLVAYCQLYPTDPRIHHKVIELLEDEVKLIEMRFTVTGYQLNPLDVSSWPRMTSWNQVDSNQSVRPYKADSWSRVSDGQGQTLLKLAFNYGILSLMTLSYGVEPLDIEFQDVPAGCLGNVTDDEERLKVVLDIVLRDMLPAGAPRVIEGQSNICYEVVEPVNSMLRFANRCCHYRLNDPLLLTAAGGVQGMPGELLCFINVPNKWLHTLDVLLATLFVAIFVTGPLFLPNWLYTSSNDTFKYTVKLNKPIHKTMCVSRTSTLTDIKFRHRLDLRDIDQTDFTRCLKVIRHLPSDVIIPIKIPQLDIKVNYGRLLEENRVPVSLVECLSKALFLCKLRELDTFRDCCDASYINDWYRCPLGTGRPRPWFDLCETVGRILLVLLLPLPFYIRLALYYHFEHAEVVDRNRVASKFGDLPVYYSYHLLQYLTPAHPIFVGAYFIYFTVGIYLACFSQFSRKQSRFQHALADSFADLKRMSWLNAMSMLVRNLLYPFRRFGFLGCLICFVVYPILIPLSCIFCFVYSLPVVYLSCRVVRHIFTDEALTHTSHRQRKRRSAFNEMIHAFEADTVVKYLKRNKKRSVKTCTCYIPGWKPLVRHCSNLFVSLIALLVIFSVLLMIAEVVGYVAEIGCFTMMGLIVNATKVLKYGSLIFLLIIYSNDSYSNVTKKYQKLNKALFSEIKSRISGLAEFTSLPSYLQENMGFKAGDGRANNTECSTTDEFAVTPPRHWNITDLILFVDSEDIPRIPKQIFDDACQIKVAGTPGPVYLSLLKASQRFIVIIFFLVFVFIVVMSFGDSYKISSTNQMLAAMAGGFIPFIFNSLLKPVSADIETNLVGFKSKLEEIIKNCRHAWPMSDLVFNVDVAIDTASDNNGMTQQANTYCPDLTNPLIEADDIKSQVEQMTFNPATGKTVDFVVLINDDISEWDFELSSIGSVQS